MSNNQNCDLFEKIVYTNTKINGKLELIWSYMPLRVNEGKLSMCLFQSIGGVLKGRRI
jgi:hypothetical protein